MGGAKLGFLTEQFPRSHGVYIIKARGCVLYVGQSYFLRRRWSNHPWRKFVEINFPDATVQIVRCNKENLLKVEARYIEKLDPLLNGNNEKRAVKFFGLDPDWRKRIVDSPEYRKWATERRKLFQHSKVKFPYDDPA